MSYDISGEYWLDQAGAGDADNGGVGGELGVGRYHEHARNRFKASVVDIALKGATGIRGLIIKPCGEAQCKPGHTLRHKARARTRTYEELLVVVPVRKSHAKALSNLIPYEIDNLKIVYAGQNLSKGFATGVDFKLFGQFVPGTDSWLSFSPTRL